MDMFLIIFSFKDIKHGRKNAILQKWWSLLVYGSHNSRYSLRSSSFDRIDLPNNSRGMHQLCPYIYIGGRMFVCAGDCIIELRVGISLLLDQFINK